MGASGTPIFKSITADDVGVTIDFGQQVSGIALKNDGPNVVYWVDGDTAPPASKGNGRCSLEVNEVVSLANLSVQTLSFICATGETAVIQAAAVPQGEVSISKAPSGGPATPSQDVDLSGLGVNAVPVGGVIAGPIPANILLASFNIIGWDRLNVALADFAAVSQGDLSDTGYLDISVEVELDGSTVFTPIYNLRMNITSAASGGGGNSSAWKECKPISMAALKLLGSTVTQIQANLTLVQTSGIGVAIGAVDFTDAALLFAA